MLKRNWPFLLLLVLLLGLQASFWFGNGSWPTMHGMRDQVDKQRSENASLKQRNDALKAEVEDLKSGEAAVEERARNELGMIKPGETFYRVVDPKKKTSEQTQQEADSE